MSYTFHERFMPYGAVVGRRSDGKKVWVFFNRDYQPINRQEYWVRQANDGGVELSRRYVEYDYDLDGVVLSPTVARKVRELAHVPGQRTIGVSKEVDRMHFYHNGYLYRPSRSLEVLRLLMGIEKAAKECTDYRPRDAWNLIATDRTRATLSG